MNLEYLKDYPKNPCYNIWIINAGLKNVPELKSELQTIINKLQDDIDNTDSHLSDIGCQLAFLSNDLKRLSDKVFAAHKIEKNQK